MKIKKMIEFHYLKSFPLYCFGVIAGDWEEAILAAYSGFYQSVCQYKGHPVRSLSRQYKCTCWHL